MLNPRDVSDRRILAADRELRSLNRRLFTIVRLETPYQRGWRRSYVLNEQSLNRADQPALEAILKVIGSTIIHHNRDFQRRRRRSKKLYEIEQPLRPIPNNEWIFRKYPVEWLRYFRYELRLENNRHWQPYWIFTHPALYRLKISRNMIHQVRIIDPDVERRMNELNRWFDIQQARYRLGWLKGRRQNYYLLPQKRQKALDREHRREIARAYQIFPAVDPAASVWRIPTSLRPILFIPA